ncbi:hypothetical protein ElyMa_004375300 [Elysia marginata]|uniref:Uncharacterized protein n=1 Tax=Elysia marginata TaxID=1093978 RepID=A0AAV4H536_9GAST|nr:hypothetical protein ElyMa_004375300 [Elysia marginata]
MVFDRLFTIWYYISKWRTLGKLRRFRDNKKRHPTVWCSLWCDQRRAVCSTRSLRQVSPGRREDSDPQQPGSLRRMSGSQEEGQLTRTAKVD